MLYTCTVNNIDVSSNVLWVRELVWWCCASEPVHWHEKKNNESFFHFLRNMIVFDWFLDTTPWDERAHYVLLQTISAFTFTLIWTLKIFSSLSLIIVIMKINYESMSHMLFIFFLSQGICHIKIESEGSIWFVNLY